MRLFKIILAFHVFYFLPGLPIEKANSSTTTESKIILENKFVRFDFSKDHVGLTAMVNLETGVNHILPIEKSAKLWQVTFGR